MMKALKFSFTNIWRNKVLSLATIFVMSIIIFIFNVILSLNFLVNDSIQSLNENLEINAYIKDSLSQEEITELQNYITSIKGVKSVEYITKDDALALLKENHPSLNTTFENYEIENPLPQSLKIQTLSISYNQDILTQINNEEFKNYFISLSPENKENTSLNQVSETLLKLSNFTKKISYLIIIVFIMGGALIIVNALNLTIYSRKKDIEIMQIVGASHKFIKTPFIIESIFFAISSILLNILFIYLLSFNTDIQSLNLITILTKSDLVIIFSLELIFTLVLNTISSIITVHEHLKK